MEEALSKCRKQISEVDIETLFKKMTEKFEKHYGTISKLSQQVPGFVRGCLRVSWKMVTQYPPMVYAEPPTKDDPYDGTIYRQYMTAGDKVDYFVWPAILEQTGGPLVAKGVVQCYKSVGFQSSVSSRKSYARDAGNKSPADSADPLHVSKGAVIRKPAGNAVDGKAPAVPYEQDGTTHGKHEPNVGTSATYPKELVPPDNLMARYNRYLSWNWSEEEIEKFMSDDDYLKCKNYVEWRASLN